MILYHISKYNFDKFKFKLPYFADHRYTCMGPVLFCATTIETCIRLADIGNKNIYVYQIEVDDRLLHYKYSEDGEIVITHSNIVSLLRKSEGEDREILVKMAKAVRAEIEVENNKFFQIIKKEYIKGE